MDLNQNESSHESKPGHWTWRANQPPQNPQQIPANQKAADKPSAADDP